MESVFETAYARLNARQKQAVDTIEGPVLVIAGPGTGKTQLLSVRIANILRRTDTLPENILCLTFTDSGVAAMRERLVSIIGQAAYDVNINTYHAFGSELLRRYPEFFTEGAELQPADDLTIDTIFRAIQARLPYSNPMKYETFLMDVKQLVSDCKRALLTPDDVRAIARANQQFITTASEQAREVLRPVVRIDKKAVPAFETLLQALQDFKAVAPVKGIVPLAVPMRDELANAMAATTESGKTTTLTKWKNTWLAKDVEGQWIVAGEDQARRLQAAAVVYEAYLHDLNELGLYDYDDMILRAIRGLEAHQDLRYSLQERYLYLLLDEYQDTNEAQARIVELLTDNPVNEGRPNVLAVGDDDQAIYAFQGANYSHMLHFYEHYRDVLVVPLTDNYRSHADVLRTAEGISGQITSRLHHHFPAVDKTLRAANPAIKQPVVARHDFKTTLTQNAWVAERIVGLIREGVPANEIAVLAPKHEYLEALVPFLHHNAVPVHYEKRENVLDDPAVGQLVLMSRLVLALSSNDSELADSLWPRVLSLDFWKFPTSLVWQLSWHASDEKKSWTDLLCQTPDTKPTALFFLRLSQLVGSETLEQLLDRLMGIATVDLHEPGLESFRSPYYAYYFDGLDPAHEDTQGFWQLLSNLTVLRERVRDYRAYEPAPLELSDFIAFVDASHAANLKILNTNPYQEATAAVELMTAYKAKGQEFTAVFIIAAIDEAWGTKARALGNRLSLPPNLQFIRYAGTTEDERLRLLYVALTRAKQQLYITSYQSTYSGKKTTRLKYLAEYPDEAGQWISPHLPAATQIVQSADSAVPALEELTVHWQHRHYQAVSQPLLRELLQPRLAGFQLSATELNSFLDLQASGPAAFFLTRLLHFPVAPSISNEFGKAVHETLEWVHVYARQHQALPTAPLTVKTFEKRLQRKRLPTIDHQLLMERGRESLQAYLQQRGASILLPHYTEYNFRGEGAFAGEAHLSGKVDKLIVDKKARSVVIVDYKTGRSHSRWERTPRLHFYRYQLYFYKLLVERSQTFRGYRVSDAYLEFVEPDEHGEIKELHVAFDADTQARLELLIDRVWQHVHELRFPDVSGYTPDMKGIEQFEADLLNGDI